jgi:prevent-host-death family protein
MTNSTVRRAGMTTVSIAAAKARLSELIDRAAGGVTVQITRRGKPVARIVAVGAPRRRIDIAALRSMLAAMPAQAEPARDFVRRMRDDARY